jgi:hypothetical protein
LKRLEVGRGHFELTSKPPYVNWILIFVN